jgi:putative nucleotidyltransferase with HDIG domain
LGIVVDGRLAIVCDVAHENQAGVLGEALVAKVFLLDELVAKDLIEFDIVVLAELRDSSVVEVLRRKLGPRASTGQRYFVYDQAPPGRAWQVQADALGATLHVPQAGAVATLRRLRSIVSVPRDSRPIGGVAGPSIDRAERAIARVFGDLLDGAPLGLNEVTVAGLGVLNGVDGAGGAEWLSAVKNHHEGTFQHCLLVAGVAAIYARGSELSTAQSTALMNAAILHDIGKAAVPLDLLDKPGKLTDEEFEVVKRHPGYAHQYLVQRSSTPAIVLDAVRHHHEALDGTGYPDGLRGDAITPLTRILTVCDIYAALIERRAYKDEKTPEQAISVLIDLALRSKVDYAMVRRLATAVGVKAPDDLSDLVRNLTQPRRAVG